MEYMIRTAIERGIHTYDFLQGDEEYKYDWQATNRYDHHLQCLNGLSVRFTLRTLDFARAAWRLGKGLWRNRSEPVEPEEET